MRCLWWQAGVKWQNREARWLRSGMGDEATELDGIYGLSGVK
jgi:hypothetical protein